MGTATLMQPTMFQGMYPWSRLGRSTLSMYMRLNPKDPRVDWVAGRDAHVVDWLAMSGLKDLNNDFDFDNWEARWMVNDTAGGLARWLQGGRRLVTITDKSTKLLLEQSNRINEVPLCRDEKPWRLGYMFKLMDYLIYVEPAPSAVGRGVQLGGWYWSSTLKHPEQVYEPAWVPIGFKAGRDPEGRRIIRGYEICDRLSEESEKTRLAYGPHGMRINMEIIRHISINAFASLHALPDVRVLQAPRKGRLRRTSTVGGLRGVKRLTLNESGTRLAMTLRIRERGETRMGSTRTVGLHHVDQHHWRVWVNTPKVHEHVLATRTKINCNGETHIQFRVRRLRGPKDGYVRGLGPLKVTKATMVTGIDDPGGE